MLLTDVHHSWPHQRNIWDWNNIVMHLITCPNWLLLWHGCFISGRLALHLHFHKNNWCALGNYSNDDIFQISLIPFFFAGRKQASRWIFSSWLSCLSSGGQRSPSRWARASKLSYIHTYIHIYEMPQQYSLWMWFVCTVVCMHKWAGLSSPLASKGRGIS